MYTDLQYYLFNISHLYILFSISLQLQPPRGREGPYLCIWWTKVMLAQLIKYLEELRWHTTLFPDMHLVLSGEEQDGSGS